MFKRIICTAAAVLLFTVSVSAGTPEVKISAGAEFEIYRAGENAGAAAEILGMTGEALESYCTENGIVCLAVNRDNSKQIRVSVTESAFSGSIGNLTNLADDKILALIPDITGINGARGEIVTKDRQKFVRTYVSASDSGGEYTVIQYFTAAAKKDYVLTFYTASGADTDYTEAVFKSYTSADFYRAEKEKSHYGYIIIAAIALLAIGSIYIIFTLVRDIRSDRRETNGPCDDEKSGE